MHLLTTLTTWLALIIMTKDQLVLSAEYPSNLTLEWYEGDCRGGDNALLSTGLRVIYESNSTAENGLVERYFNDVWVDSNVPELELAYYEGTKPRNVTSVGYSIVQPEHGGFECYCVKISFKSTRVNRPSSDFFNLCGGRPDQPRRINIEWPPISPLSTNTDFNNEVKVIPFSLNCSGQGRYYSVSFDTYTSRLCSNGGGGLELGDEIEFSIRYLSNPSEWIPISLTVMSTPIQTRYSREYQISVIKAFDSSFTQYQFDICNHFITDSFQLRWLALSCLINPFLRDSWSLDNVRVDLNLSSTMYTFMDDSFQNSSLNCDYWTPHNIRNGRLSDACSNGIDNNALLFGDEIQSDRDIVSGHSALTNIFNPLQIICDEAQPQSPRPEICKILVQTASLGNSSLHKLEQSIRQLILQDIILSERLIVYSASEAVAAIPSADNSEPLNLVYLLGTVLKDITSAEPPSLIQNTVSTGQFILQQCNSSVFSTDEGAVVGTTLITSVEKLIVLRVNDFMLVTPNIKVKIITVPASQSTFTFSTAECERRDPPYVSISLPLNRLLKFATDNVFRLFISVYRNVSKILPEGIPDLPGSTLASDVFGASLLCDSKICPTSNLSLSRPVVITFEHDEIITERLKTNSSLTTLCVFLDIQAEASGQILHQGLWSQRGCTTRMSSTSRTVCECNHLTHFAILLSAKPPNFGSGVTLSLTAIGYVGVIVSLVSMAIIIAVFILLKKQRGFRGYIHINLCINLSVAQILFIAGVDKTGRPEDGVPGHCKFVAVLLHYFFLTTFMWMLMEGAFLYLALVKVFMTNTKKYIILFTALSYGIPLVYMVLLTMPLGFGLSEHHYGYKQACFLRPDSHFTLAFILPVIAIFGINIGFLVMASVILWKQQKKRTSNTESTKILSWVKAVISLTVVMGLTWIIGLLVVELEELAPVAYIYTIAVAFQGFFILLVLVVFTEAVRNDLKEVFLSKSEKIMKKFSGSVTEESTVTSSTKDKEMAAHKVDSKDEGDMKEKKYKIWTRNPKESSLSNDDRKEDNKRDKKDGNKKGKKEDNKKDKKEDNKKDKKEDNKMDKKEDNKMDKKEDNKKDKKEDNKKDKKDDNKKDKKEDKNKKKGHFSARNPTLQIN